MAEEPAFFAQMWGLQVEPEGQGLLGGREGKGKGRGEGRGERREGRGGRGRGEEGEGIRMGRSRQKVCYVTRWWCWREWR